MKKNSFLLLFAIILATASQAQVGWQATKLDNILTVKFPGEAQKTTNSGIDSYLYKGQDSVMYHITSFDYKVVMNLDSTSLAKIKDTQRFAEGLKEGIASKKTNYTFGDITIGKLETYTVYNMSGTDNKNKNKLSIEMILIGSKMYFLSCRVPDKQPLKNSETFFSSAEVSKK